MRNTEIWGEMDPFVVLTAPLSGTKVRTRVIDEGGRHPVWNETFTLPVNSQEDVILVKCFDEDVIMDDFVGEGTFTVEHLVNTTAPATPHMSWYELTYKGKKSAEIRLECRLVQVY